MALESPRPVWTGGYAEEAAAAGNAGDPPRKVKLRLRCPEQAPEAEPENATPRHLFSGVLHGFSFQPAAALKRAQEQLDAARASGDEQAESAALLAVADAQAAKEDDFNEGPASAWRLACEVAAKDSAGAECRAAALHVAAKAKLALGEMELAAQTAQESLQLFRALQLPEGEAATLNVLAQAQLKEDADAALASAERGRDIFRRLGDARARMLERTAVGAKVARGETAEALADAEACLARCRVDAGQRLDEAAALVVLAEVHNHREEWRLVAKRAAEAAELFEGGRDEAAARHLAARALLSTGEAAEALSLAEEAQEIFRKLRDKPREMACRGLVVSALLDLDQKEKALELAQQGLEALRQRRDHLSCCEALQQLAKVHLAGGASNATEASKARQAAEEARNLAGRLRTQKCESQAAALELLVEACRQEGDFEAMTQASQELAASCRELAAPKREARALRLCTRGELALRRPKRAIEAAGRAMTLFSEQGDTQSADEMRALFARAQTLREAMREAAREARQAWLLFKERGDPSLLFEAAKNCHDAQHQFDDQNVLLLRRL